MRFDLRRAITPVVVVACLGMLGAIGSALLHAARETESLARARTLVTRLLLGEERLNNTVMEARDGLRGDSHAMDVDLTALETLQHQLGGLALPPTIHAAITRYVVAARNEHGRLDAFSALNAGVRAAVVDFVRRMNALEPELPDAGPNRNVQHQLGRILSTTMLQAFEPRANDLGETSTNRALATFSRAEAALPEYRTELQALGADYARIARDIPRLRAAVAAVMTAGTQPALFVVQSAIDQRTRQQSDLHARENAAFLALVAVMLGALALLGMRHTQSIRAGLRERVLLRSLIDNIPDLVWFKDPDGVFLACNPAFERYCGQPERAVLGKTDHDFVAAEQADSFRAYDIAAMQAGGPTRNEETIRFADDGHVALLQTTKIPIRAADGTVLGVLGIARDITRERRDAEELRSHRDDLEALVRKRTADLESAHQRLLQTQFAMDRVGIGIQWTDPRDGRFMHVNQYSADMLGYSVSELLGMRVTDIDPDLTPERFADTVARVRADGSYRYQTTQRTRSGASIAVERTLYYHAVDDGSGDRIIAFVTEISQRKRYEAELIQARDTAETVSRANRQLVDQLEAANRELARSDQRLNAMLALSQKSGELDEAELLRSGVDEAVRLTDSRIGYLHFIHDDQESIALKVWSSGTTALCNAAHSSHYPIAQAGVWADSVRLKRPVMHNAYSQLAARRELPAGHAPLRRHLGVPVVEGDTVRMVVGVGNKETPYDDADVSQLQLVAHDLWQIVKRRKAEIELGQAKLAAEAATRAKSIFLANMSHEIRTPLNAVTGMTHLALQTELGDKQRYYIESVHGAAESLLEIIDDILDFSKIEAGRLELERIEFRLDDVMSRLANMVGKRAEDKGLELLFMPMEAVPNALLGDPLRLTQILVNLVSNAIKFTQHGEVTVGVETVQRDASGVELHFWVKDTGIGITDEQRSRLFQSFSQADGSTTRQYGGTGLGLAISRTLVEMMQGRIWLESQPASGSTFHFHARFGESAAAAPAHAQDAAALRGVRVLVVDDNQASRDILALMLQRFGVDVELAAGCREAIDAVALAERALRPYALALLDWKMPHADGIDCMRALRRHATHVPALVMVTAFGREQALREARSRGVPAPEILAKPVTPSALLEAISHALGRPLHDDTRTQRRANRHAQAMAQLGGARVLVVEDNRMNQQMVVDLLDKAGVEVVLADNGAQALELLARDQRFDCILMDCQMPVMDGYTATRELRSSSAVATLPVIALTANAMAEDRVRALEAGMNDHIAKPIDVDQMFATMARWIAPGARRAPLAVAGAEPDGAIDDLGHLPGIDLRAGLARCAGDAASYRRLLRHFVDGQRDFVDAFTASWNDGDHASALRLAHTLKGNAGQIGADELHAAAQTLEHVCRHAPAAPDASCAAPLRAVAQALGAVLEGLRARLGAPQVRAAADQTADAAPGAGDGRAGDAALHARMLGLRALLAAGDADAIDAAESIRDALVSSRHAAAFGPVAEAVSSCDFDRAVAQLAPLLETLGHGRSA